jgi:hypothetical protein
MELIQLYSNHFIKTTRKFYQGKSMKLRKGMVTYKWSWVEYPMRCDVYKLSCEE